MLLNITFNRNQKQNKFEIDQTTIHLCFWTSYSVEIKCKINLELTYARFVEFVLILRNMSASVHFGEAHSVWIPRPLWYREKYSVTVK